MPSNSLDCWTFSLHRALVRKKNLRRLERSLLSDKKGCDLILKREILLSGHAVLTSYTAREKDNVLIVPTQTASIKLNFGSLNGESRPKTRYFLYVDDDTHLVIIKWEEKENEIAIHLWFKVGSDYIQVIQVFEELGYKIRIANPQQRQARSQLSSASHFSTSPAPQPFPSAYSQTSSLHGDFASTDRQIHSRQGSRVSMPQMTYISDRLPSTFSQSTGHHRVPSHAQTSFRGTQRPRKAFSGSLETRSAVDSYTFDKTVSEQPTRSTPHQHFIQQQISPASLPFTRQNSGFFSGDYQITQRPNSAAGPLEEPPPPRTLPFRSASARQEALRYKNQADKHVRSNAGADKIDIETPPVNSKPPRIVLRTTKRRQDDTADKPISKRQNHEVPVKPISTTPIPPPSLPFHRETQVLQRKISNSFLPNDNKNAEKEKSPLTGNRGRFDHIREEPAFEFGTSTARRETAVVDPDSQISTSTHNDCVESTSDRLLESLEHRDQLLATECTSKSTQATLVAEDEAYPSQPATSEISQGNAYEKNQLYPEPGDGDLFVAKLMLMRDVTIANEEKYQQWCKYPEVEQQRHYDQVFFDMYQTTYDFYLAAVKSYGPAVGDIPFGKLTRMYN